MTDLKITATAYQDPLFDRIRKQTESCSDDYPVLMLPVRLETRFMKEKRYIMKDNPDEIHISNVIDIAYEVIYEQILAIKKGKVIKPDALHAQMLKANDKLSDIINRLKSIGEICPSDRQIIRNTLNAIGNHLRNAILKGEAGNSDGVDAMQQKLATAQDHLRDIPGLRLPPTQPGLDAFNELCSLEQEMMSVYGEEDIQAAALDDTLDKIEGHLHRFMEIMEEPNLLADKNTIQKIKSKISFIKRSQKNSPVRLTDFQQAYPGQRDLRAAEYRLRNEINDLKARIDQDYVPYMELLARMEKFPIRQLMYQIVAATTYLKATNNAGYQSLTSLLAERTPIYRDLRRIRQHAHIPLLGSYLDINRLKTKYAQLEREVLRYIDHAGKHTPQSLAHRIGVARLRTHLTREYLTDLKQMRPGENEAETQIFSNDKMRSTATAAQTTLNRISEIKKSLKNIRSGREAAAITVHRNIEDLKKSLAASTTNTILLPKEKDTEINRAYQGLKSVLENCWKANRVSENHVLAIETEGLMQEIRQAIKDQQKDVYDLNDPFYDDFRKRITFLVRSEVINELWVRIYPDDIAIDNHDPDICENEAMVGRQYYNEIYSQPAEARQEAMLPAWRAAAASLGPRRAAWVIARMLPDKIRNNQVLEIDPVDKLHPIAAQLSEIVSVPRSQWPANHLEGIISFVINLPVLLSEVLKPANFTPCERTRTTIESMIKVLNKGIERYEQLYDTEDTFHDTTIEQEHECLVTARNITSDYYKTHRAALHLPFDPRFTFPDIHVKQQAWTRPAITNVMPDRFVVITKRGDAYRQIKVGRAIPRNIQVGINPAEHEADQFQDTLDGGLDVPEKIRWMYNFEDAVANGMAVRVPLQKEDFEEGFTFVMAYGVYTHEGVSPENKPMKGQAAINSLFTGHLYTDGGLEYLPVGTATNNTDHVKSPYQTLDNDYDGLYKLFIEQSATHGNLSYTDQNELKISDGQFFRDALGLPDKIASLIRNHDKQDIVESRAMSRILFGSTLGFTMRFMFRNILTSNDMSQVVPFMMKHVSAVGNLPAFRIDNQPYGCMPITLHRKLWINDSITYGTFGSFVHKLSMFLAATRKVFEKEMIGKVKTINHHTYTNDPQGSFLEILGLEPYSKEFSYREGANVANRWGRVRELKEDDILSWDDIDKVNPDLVRQHYEYLLSRCGFSNAIGRLWAINRTRMYGARFVNLNDIMGALVQHPDHGTTTLHHDQSGRNFIRYLRELSMDTKALFSIDKNAIIDKKWNTLLFELLRFAFLYDNGRFSRAAAARVENLEVPVLERLMAGHIDLCSYRIDAWQSGLADYRLRELRSKEVTGTFIGAYGFLENLKPSKVNKQRVQHPPQGLEPTDGSEIYTMPDNQGFIHGPSMNHAVTAAVIRAGYNSLKKSNGNSPFSVNMSGVRVREALFMMEGVAHGQQTGALLGYKFERALHEKYKDNDGKHLEMDRFIYRLRRKFPTGSDKEVEDTGGAQQHEAIRPVNVIDGLALLEHIEKFIQDNANGNNPAMQWDAEKTFSEMMISTNSETLEFYGYPWGLGNELPPITTAAGASNIALNKLKVKAIVNELDHLANTLDAMADLVTAEGVYQLVRGNHTRANAVLSAMGDGRIPTDPEIIRSMREGVMVTHRVLVATKADDLPAAWSQIPATPYAKAEPAINQWLAQQIGDPARIGWTVQVHGDQYTDTIHCTIADLGLQAYDLVMMICSGEQGLAELEAMAFDAAQEKGASADAKILFQFSACPPDADASLGEYFSLLQQLGSIIANLRPADARDFRNGNEYLYSAFEEPAVDTEELAARIASGISDYQGLLADMHACINAAGSNVDLWLQTANAVLRKCALWGFRDHYPAYHASGDVESQLNKIRSATALITSNLHQAQQKLAAITVEPDQSVWIEAAGEVGELLYGKGFKLLPLISLPEASDLQQIINYPREDGLLRALPDNGVEQWLNDVAMVRKKIAPFDTMRMLQEVLQTGRQDIGIVQLPVDLGETNAINDYWMGAEYPESWEPQDDKLSLIVIGHENMGQSFAAFALDEWMEIIPDRIQTTGVGLHYNQPDARPPQTLLLAVSPVLTGKWSADDLALIVEEAYTMARVRATEPDQFRDTMLAQILPAITLIADGDLKPVKEMFSIPPELDSEGKKGAVVDFGSVNHGEAQTSIPSSNI